MMAKSLAIPSAQPTAAAPSRCVKTAARGATGRPDCRFARAAQVHLDLQPLGVGAHPAGEAHLGQAPDEWTETDALDDAGQADALAMDTAWIFELDTGALDTVLA